MDLLLYENFLLQVNKFLSELNVFIILICYFITKLYIRLNGMLDSVLNFALII